MKKPNPAMYLLGNPASVLAIMVGGGFLIYQWWEGLAPSDWVPVLAFLAMASAANAHEKLSAYHNWKRAWDAMGGVSTAARNAWVRPLAGLVISLIIAVGLTGLNYRDPENVAVAAGFAVIALAVLGRLYFRYRPVGRTKRHKDIPVSIVVPVPRASPGRREFARDLPAYCGRLF